MVRSFNDFFSPLHMQNCTYRCKCFCVNWVSTNFAFQLMELLLHGPSPDLGFSRGGWFENFSKKTLIWPKFLRRILGIFGHFLENVDKKMVSFWRALSLKVSIYWSQRRLEKNSRVGRPKMDFWKSTEGTKVPLGRQGVRPPPPPLNPPLP